MKRCTYPGCEEEESLPFRCKLCNELFCAKHRLPEQHHCSKITIYQTDEYKKAKLTVVPKEEKKQEAKIKQYTFDDRKEKLKKVKQRTVATFQEQRAIHKSPMLTLYSFQKNSFNIMTGTGYVFILTSVSLAFTLGVINGFPLSQWGYLFGYLVAGYFIATALIYGGHMIVENYFARKKGVSLSHVLWLQGLFIGLIGIFLPFIFHPNFILFRDYTDNEDAGKVALSGVVWMFSIEILGFILFVLSVTNVINLGIVFNIALGRILITYLVFLLFSLFPFFYNNGFYISGWNKKINWWLIGAVFAFTLTQIILDFIFLAY